MSLKCRHEQEMPCVDCLADMSNPDELHIQDCRHGIYLGIGHNCDWCDRVRAQASEDEPVEYGDYAHERWEI